MAEIKEKIIYHTIKLKSEIKPYPSLALGCVDTTLIEAVGMFNVFANNGLYVEPHYIKWVKEKHVFRRCRGQSGRVCKMSLTVDWAKFLTTILY